MPAAKPASKRPRAKASGPKQSQVESGALNAALAEAAWLETDAALAEALALHDEWVTAPPANRAALSELLAQALGRAARKRGLSRVGEIDANERFDALRHDFAGSRPPKIVRVVARGVARGDEILVRARAVRGGAVRAKSAKKGR